MIAPIRIVHVLFRFGIGGLENGIVNLVNGLDPARYRHWIVCLADYDAEFAGRLTASNVELRALDKRPGNDPRVWWRMWQLLREVRPEILHTRNFVALELQILGWCCGIRGRVHGEHGWDVNDLDGTVRKYQFARRVIGRFVQRYIALSGDLARYLRERAGIPPAKVVQIYNGVDTAKFYPRLSAKGAMLVIGTVGRMKAVKQQTLLCRAFVDVLARRPALSAELRLCLVGSGPLEEECRAIVSAAGYAALVEFRGDSSVVELDLRTMDIFVLPSLAEGVSNTILEAMACGLPVIATRVGGNAELVLDGVTGKLVPRDDVAAMALAIEHYVDDPALRAAHGQRARERVLEHFSLERMLGAYDDIYRRLAA